VLHRLNKTDLGILQRHNAITRMIFSDLSGMNLSKVTAIFGALQINLMCYQCGLPRLIAWHAFRWLSFLMPQRKRMIARLFTSLFQLLWRRRFARIKRVAGGFETASVRDYRNRSGALRGNSHKRTKRTQRGEAATKYRRTPWALIKSEV
jgi:hypothetical protein